MRITRSTKCSTKFTTNKKKEQLKTILKEYGKVVNLYINYFWQHGTVEKGELLKSIIYIVKDENTWLTYRLRKVAAREALDMVFSVQNIFEWNKEQLADSIKQIEKKIEKIKERENTKKNRQTIDYLHCLLKKKKMRLSMIQITRPKHTGNRMCVSSTIAELQEAKGTKEFNAWLHLNSIGNKISLDIPIKYHKHFRQLQNNFERLNSYVITLDSVQFVFVRETGPKKEIQTVAGVDTGINALASVYDGTNKQQFGKDIKERIERIKRCKKGSNGQQKAIRALKQYIDENAKIVVSTADLVVVEKLSDLNSNSKLKGRLSTNMRSSIGSWNYAYWLMRVEYNCQDNRVSFRTVAPYNTSITCPACCHINSKNRVGEIFKCQCCGFTGNADLDVAALNIRKRFLIGKYGSCYKLDNPQKLDNMVRNNCIV